MRIESLGDSYNKWVKIFPTPKRIKGGRDGQELPDEEHDWVLGTVVNDSLPIENRARHFISAVRLEDIDRLDEHGCLWLRVQIKMSGDDLWFEPHSPPSPDDARLLQYREPHMSDTKMFASSPELDWNEYGNAYSNAAKLMARTASGDITSMPVVFLYRHAIELKMKGIVVTFGDLTSAERGELYR